MPGPTPVLYLSAVCLLACSCFDSSAAQSPGATQAQAAGDGSKSTQTAKAGQQISLPEDSALEPWRLQLIELAMDAASAFPLHPHIKNRSVAQESVVETCIALGQPRRALEYSTRIGNWRRGVGYSALALHLAESGISEGVDDLIAMAEVEARLEGEDNPQDWQQDMIRSRIAAALLQLGRAGDAQPFEQELEDSEVGTVLAAKAALVPRDELDARLADLDRLLPVATFDQLRSALQAAVELYDRSFAQPELRASCVDWIERASKKVPAQIRIEVRLDLAARAAAQGDQSEALAQVSHAREILDSVNWAAEDQVPLVARIAEARARAGDREKAGAELAEAGEIFEKGRQSIPDYWRGAALRPVAEAWVALGDSTQAQKHYRIAAEEGSSNPNARPRCEDLVATCLSMARHGVQPDAELTARLRALREGLGDPW